jgi:hypothetical protein
METNYMEQTSARTWQQYPRENLEREQNITKPG